MLDKQKWTYCLMLCELTRERGKSPRAKDIGGTWKQIEAEIQGQRRKPGTQGCGGDGIWGCGMSRGGRTPGERVWGESHLLSEGVTRETCLIAALLWVGQGHRLCTQRLLLVWGGIPKCVHHSVRKSQGWEVKMDPGWLAAGAWPKHKQVLSSPDTSGFPQSKFSQIRVLD